MLDQILEPRKPWHAAWLDRKSDVLDTVACVPFAITTVWFFTAEFIATVRRWRARYIAYQEGRDCEEELLKIQHQQFRWQWFSGVYWLVGVLIIASVDAYIGVRTLKAGVEKAPDEFGTRTMLEIIGYSLWITVLFVAAFVTAPVLQVLGFGRLLKYGARRNPRTFNVVMPHIRAFSTSLAGFWGMLCFGLTYFWPPVGESSILRWVIVESAFGSALVWLDVSFALNFCTRSLDTLVVSRGGTGALQHLYRSIASVQQPPSEAQKGAVELPACDEETPLTTAQRMPSSV